MSINTNSAVLEPVIVPEPMLAGAAPELSVAELAYQLWKARGCPHGSDQEDWFLAEGILKSRRENQPDILH